MIPDVTKIMAYEEGELDEAGVVELFQGLVDSGVILQLQGSYQRTAQRMIESGMIVKQGALEDP